jgi:hypothetical protein
MYGRKAFSGAGCLHLRRRRLLFLESHLGSLFSLTFFGRLSLRNHFAEKCVPLSFFDQKVVFIADSVIAKDYGVQYRIYLGRMMV